MDKQSVALDLRVSQLKVNNSRLDLIFDLLFYLFFVTTVKQYECSPEIG